MGCCKCEEHEWPDPQDVVYTDEADGKEYCVFHAPGDKKIVDVETFNKKVFKRIEDAPHSSSKELWCNLSGTIFPGKIDFGKSRIFRYFPNCNFSGTSFCDDASFKFCVFEHSALFSNSLFFGDAEFNSTHIHGICLFSEAIFFEKADFFRAHFYSNVLFSKTTFHGMTIFTFAVFDKGVHYTFSCFNYTSDFNLAKFMEASDFEKANFYETISFKGSKFAKEINFKNTKFINGADFNKADFFSKASFSQAVFSGTINFLEINAGIDSLLLHQIDSFSLSNIIFTSIEVDYILFSGCYTWPDKLYTEATNSQDYYASEKMYRKLKRIAASEHDQPMVSMWHFREKEMALKQIKEKRPKWWRFSWLWLYRFSSGYGEDYRCAFRILMWLLLAAFAISSLIAIISTGFSPRIDWDKVGWVFESTLRCIPLTKLPTENGNLGVWYYAFISVFQLLIGIQAALFAFALRNKFRR